MLDPGDQFKDIFEIAEHVSSKDILSEVFQMYSLQFQVYYNKEINTSLEKMSLVDYSGLLENELQVSVIVLLIQVGITLLYAKQVGTEKLDIIVGEVN